MLLTVLSNYSLLLRLLRRKHLHTIFNLGHCLYFLMAGTVFPFIISDYFDMFLDYHEHFEAKEFDPYRILLCQRSFLLRHIILQGSKVPQTNLIFRLVLHIVVNKNIRLLAQNLAICIIRKTFRM